MSPEAYREYITTDLPETLSTLPNFSDAIFTKLIPTIRERVNTRAEFHDQVAAGEYNFAFAAPTYDTDLLKWKNDADVTAAKPRLEHALSLLEAADFSTPETIKAALWPYAEEIGKGEIFWPLRVALSGRAQSPDPFTIAHIIGKEETRLRIEAACAKIGG